MARRKKLSKVEKIEHDIRLNLRKQERAVEMQAKAAKMLRTSAQALARLHKYQRKLEAKVAHDLVTTQVESPLPERPVEPTVGELARGTDSLPAPVKPKRQRKPKPTENGRLSPPDLVNKIYENREKRMKALGFRKTGKRKLADTTEKH